MDNQIIILKNYTLTKEFNVGFIQPVSAIVHLVGVLYF
jgi:hypothetical protein